MDNRLHDGPMDYARRDLPADVARALRLGRRARGWSLRVAARNLGVSAGHLCHIERRQRAPSSVVAEILIDGYRLGPFDAGRLRAVAVRDAGRASPWKLGVATRRPEPREVTGFGIRSHPL
jgi:hypothetical protein